MVRGMISPSGAGSGTGGKPGARGLNIGGQGFRTVLGGISGEEAG
jgi:hypothetical protein